MQPRWQLVQRKGDSGARQEGNEGIEVLVQGIGQLEIRGREESKCERETPVLPH